MRALLVDDDPSMRMLLRRLLGREFNVECLEAENGIAALEMLRQHPVDLVALDIRMPLMDGVDVLSAVRSSPEHRQLPVVIMSTMDEDDTVKKIVSLGISDYLLKPFNSAVVQHRLGHLLKSGELQRQRRPVKIAPESTVLVVDGDAQCAALFAGILRESCDVHVATDGIDAFKRALHHQTTYSAIVIGQDLGLLGRDMLVGRLRSESKTRFIPVVGLGVDAQHESLYDAVLPRTFVAEVAREALTQVMGGSSSPRGYFHPGGTLEQEARKAVMQAIGMLTHVDMRPVADLDVSQVHRWATASQELSSAHFGVDAQLLVPMSEARALAAARDGREAQAVGEDQALGLLAEILTTLSSRLAVLFEGRGHAVSAGPQRSRAVSNTGGWPTIGTGTAVLSPLQTADGSVSLASKLVWVSDPSAVAPLVAGRRLH